MKEKRQSIHGLWSSRFVFILAATGSAVGLGNIWKFPYIAGQNGGGAFVMIYLLCAIVIGIPLLMAEIMLGRSGRQNPASTMETLAEESNRSKHWKWVGFMAVIVGPLILSYYSVIAGWALAYVFKSATGVFNHIPANDAKELFENFISDPSRIVIWHSAIMLVTLLVIVRGIQKGIEKAINFMFPGMLILLVVIVGYGMASGYFIETLQYLFEPDWDVLTPQTALIALGQAFFSLSLATGAIMMYGAYLPRGTTVASSATIIALADVGVALLAGLAIFPIVFANGLETAAGPGLIFETLPIAFGKMPYGSVFSTLFFVTLVFAALTSAISLLEPAVAWTVEKFSMRRSRAALAVGTVVWLLGFLTILSFNGWSGVKLFGLNFFEFIDYATATVMMPLGGLLVAVFTGWFMKKNIVREEMILMKQSLFNWWYIALRYIAPVIIVIVFLHTIGVI